MICYAESIRLYLESEMSPQEVPKLASEMVTQLLHSTKEKELSDASRGKHHAFLGI